MRTLKQVETVSFENHRDPDTDVFFQNSEIVKNLLFSKRRSMFEEHDHSKKDGHSEKCDKYQFGSIFWNDQPPGTTASKDSKAHSKGVIGFDENTGFLLVHSTPRFPVTVPAEDIHERVVLLNLNKNQTIYGQHYFCTSAKIFDLENKIAPSYLTNDVYVYDG